MTSKFCLIKDTNKKNHKFGTYCSATPTVDSRRKLSKWMAMHNIPNPVEPKDYHATLAYSKVPCPQLGDHVFPKQVKAKIIGWDLFDNGDKKCLVALLDTKELGYIHDAIHKDYPLHYDYDEYKPHVTVSYDYPLLKVPSTFPDIELRFSKFEVTALNPDYGS